MVKRVQASVSPAGKTGESCLMTTTGPSTIPHRPHVDSMPVWWPAAMVHVPNIACGRRVAKLYLRGRYCCRGCHRLTYASQREARCYQAMSRAHKIQRRLGRPGFAYPFPQKPKGMHWRTYDQWQLRFNEEADWGVRPRSSAYSILHEEATIRLLPCSCTDTWRRS